MRAVKRIRITAVLFLLAAGAAGCGLGDAARQGFFGAVTDAVQTLVIGILLPED